MHSETVSREIENDVQGGKTLNANSNTSVLGRLAGRLWFWWSLFVAGMLLLVFGPPSILAADIAGHPEWVYPWALFGARNWLRLSGARVRVHGLEHLDPQQSYVFVANHRSFLDTATLFYHLRRRIGVLAKKELLKVPILGYGMGHVNIMAIDRSNRTRAIETMKEATDLLRRGVSIGVFVEGTRAPAGELLPFKKGAFYMAIEAGVAVVPVAIKHTDMLMGKGTGMARPGLIEMVVLPPVETEGLTTDEDVKRLSAHCRELIAAELGMNVVKDSV